MKSGASGSSNAFGSSDRGLLSTGDFQFPVEIVRSVTLKDFPEGAGVQVEFLALDQTLDVGEILDRAVSQALPEHVQL